jgi:hypothetical protein
MSGKASRDYGCVIKIDEDFETVVHELRTYFVFVNLAHTCESILRFYSYDGTTNYLKLKTKGLFQGDPSEFKVICIVTLHLWGRILKMFHELRGLSYTADTTTIGRLSQVLKLVYVNKSVFKTDGNLDLNMGKTMIPAMGPTTRHVYKRVQHFFFLGHCERFLSRDVHGTRHRSTWDPFSHRSIRPEFRSSKLHKDNKGRGKD